LKTIQLSFSENPAERTALFLKERSIDLADTLVISPTQRFKSYLASALLELWKTENLMAPSLITSRQLTDLLAAYLGLVAANDAQRFSMLYTACKNTPNLNELFPEDFLSCFVPFRGIVRRILKAFDELNREEIDMDRVNASKGAYSLFHRHIEIFRNLYSHYVKVQEESRVYEKSFLLRLIREADIDTYLRRFSTVLLVSPVSLTAFEMRVYKWMSDRLFVIYQDTSDYDFSRILSFSEKGHRRSQKRNKAITIFEPSSRIDQLMITLSILHRELTAGTPANEIAVINTDSLFCDMLFDSLCAAGVPVNYSEGLMVKKSPLYGLLRLIDSFFGSGLDTRILLEILKSNIFREAFHLDGGNFYLKMKKRVHKERIFYLSSIHDSLIGDDPRIEEGFSLFHKIYHSKSFEDLYNNLSTLFSRLKGKKVYEFYAVRDILTGTALEFSDFSADMKERPFEIFLEIIKNKRYPLPGIYSRGVQVIGLLETRGVTFRKVIVPTFNEGFFPVRQNEDILLSLNVRRELELPTLVDRETLQFYYLKRIIDSSDHSYLLSLADRKGEMDVRSRFWYYFTGDLYGVKEGDNTYMLPLRTKSAAIDRPPVYQPALSSRVTEISRLDLDRLKRCETLYYIARILNIKDEEILLKQIDLNLLGLKVHALFNELYAGLGGNILEADEYRSRFHKLFGRYFRDGTFFTSEEALTKKILMRNLLEVLDRDLNRFSRGYRICTEFMEKDFTAVITDGTTSYTLKGRIDRIDRTPEGLYEIIDYKTGKLPERKHHFQDRGFVEPQLGFYGLLFRKNYLDVPIGSLSYYDLSEKKDLVTIVDADHITDYLDQFEHHLLDFLSMVNQKEELALTEDYENCKYCPYYNICRIFEE